MNKTTSLLQKFIAYNAAMRMAHARKKTLLAVSGGKDSVVMCELFYEAGFPFAIAHCNFHLRGIESDEDEQFVLALGKRYGVSVFTHQFNTKKYAEEKKISTQVAARELRYKWFEELRTAHQFHLIATAHHLSDNIETILLNFIKGTGIRGLRGIPKRNGKIIRPLLFASRSEMDAYQGEKQLKFREDSSNTTDKYTRNKIRHHLMPMLKEINPALEKTLSDKIELYNEIEQLYEQNIKKKTAQLFLQRGNSVYIPILRLKKTQNAASVLYEYLKTYEFTIEQVEDMLQAVDSSPGKQFISPSALIVKDRRFFILSSLTEQNRAEYSILESTTEVNLGEQLFKVSHLHQVPEKLTSDKNTAFIDKTKLSFPLVLRHWKPGDYFYPFGMKLKKKKLKKFFIDEKVPLHKKDTIWVLSSDRKIVWVVGYRIDERFKLSTTTTETLKLQLI